MAIPTDKIPTDKIKPMTTQVVFPEQLISALQDAIENGMTQKELAKELGISQQYLSDIIRGNRPLPGRVANLMGFAKMNTFWRNLL